MYLFICAYNTVILKDVNFIPKMVNFVLGFFFEENAFDWLYFISI